MEIHSLHWFGKCDGVKKYIKMPVLRCREVEVELLKWRTFQNPYICIKMECSVKVFNYIPSIILSLHRMGVWFICLFMWNVIFMCRISFEIQVLKKGGDIHFRIHAANVLAGIYFCQYIVHLILCTLFHHGVSCYCVSVTVVSTIRRVWCTATPARSGFVMDVATHLAGLQQNNPYLTTSQVWDIDTYHLFNAEAAFGSVVILNTNARERFVSTGHVFLVVRGSVKG